MKKNMGSADRIIRFLVVITIVILYFTGVIQGVLGIILLIAAGVFLFTSLSGFCPLYYPFKFSSKKKKKE